MCYRPFQYRSIHKFSQINDWIGYGTAAPDASRDLAWTREMTMKPNLGMRRRTTMGQLEGKTAIVTGGTTGIGLAAAKRLAGEGAHVFVTGRRKPELDAAVEAIGHGATGVQGDVAVLADLDRLYETVRGQGRRIDVLFANAGGGAFANLEQVTEEHFDQTFDINVRGLLFTVQKALPLLNDGASVIVPSSTTATTGAEAFGVYAASKAAVRSFARTWANELKGRGIRVNSITPGPIDTPGITGLAPDQEQAAGLKTFLASQVPLGRMGRSEEIADAVLFLATDSSSFITGANLDVDGGMNQV
ncbi:NAD(P)-dependent dehydrogenase (short-subunit alcohol dehydrogenase family) [Streptomyces sp. 846.5]|nr:NAD(P)-dependent dehydrogenase (short-subunit alcohol dehydrogenase family) [Streptomyces sp. 846.5]